FCHVVLAGKKWAIVEHADAPVEVGGRIFLNDDQIGTIQEIVDENIELSFVFRFVHTLGEITVGLLQNAGKTDLLNHVVFIATMDNDGLWCWNIVLNHELIEK